jgi:nicotinamidase-related amidase
MRKLQGMTQRKTPAPKKRRAAKPLKVPCRDEREYVFEPARTALLAIDMQRDFFGGDDEDGADDEEQSSAMRDVVPKVAALLAAVRGAGCHIVHTREGYASDLSDVTAYRKSLGYVGREGPGGRFLIRGEWGHDFLDEVAPLAGELVIDKPGFSAFYGSNLHAQLQAAGVDHLILCGVTTQCCVHSTLREAVDLGYWCLTVADCCAAEEPALHDAALRLITGEGDLFGWIAELEGVLAAVTPSV